MKRKLTGRCWVAGDDDLTTKNYPENASKKTLEEKKGGVLQERGLFISR